MKIKKNLFVVLSTSFIVVAISFKIFFSGLYPYPGDLLVSYNFPWYSGGWEGYNSWTTHKEFFAADAVRQAIPWVSVSTEQFKKLSVPLWNPYNFSGNPLLANPQSLTLNVFHLLFFIMPFFQAWMTLIIMQIPLAILFTYLFLRSLGLGKAPSVFSGFAYGFSTYFIYWMEIAVIGHTILWFPLILYSIQKLFEKFKIRFLTLLIMSSAACALSGALECEVYIFIISFIFFCIKILKLKESGKRQETISFLILWILFTFSITAIQLLPTWELYKNSPLTASLSKEAFKNITMPVVNLLTLFSPDFFGNKATNNFWSLQYGDGTPNIGILPFFFAIFSLLKIKRWEVKFFLFVSLIFLLFVTKSPLYLLVAHLNIPILTGTTPVRTMFVFSFSLSILAGFGLDNYLKSDKKQKFYRLVIVFILIYLVLFSFTIVLPKILKSKELWVYRMSISKRNLILPFFALLSLPLVACFDKLLSKITKKRLRLDTLVILLVTVLTGLYQFNKISPFSPKQYFFPDHPLITWLQKNISINRFYGFGTSYFGTNFATYYRVNSAEGYSVLRIKRYADLFASQIDGKVPETYERADAIFNGTFSNNEKRLLDLTGTKYIISKDDQAKDARIDDSAKPNDDVTFTWQSGKFIVYQRNKALQRYFLSSDYLIAKNDQEILNNIYDNNFDLHTVILEETPKLNIEKPTEFSVTLVDHTPNEINFSARTDANTLLFLSDSYYPGWNGYVDGKITKILRADYAFRAIEIPKGAHEVEFKYEPRSFQYGAIISFLAAVGLFVLVTISIKKQKF